MVAALSSLDWSAIGINVGVFAGAASALFVGIKQGLKKITKGDISPNSDKKQITAAMIVESTTMAMWSESNRDVTESNRDMIVAINELRHDFGDLKSTMVELRHQVERLRDKMA